jgi:ketol-acid reductoisomerase
MRYSVSNTAEWGDYVSGPRVIGDESKKAMKQILAEIQDGTFAKRWIEENKNGRPEFNATRRAEQDQTLEQVGANLRSMMPFVDPIEIKQGE